MNDSSNVYIAPSTPPASPSPSSPPSGRRPSMNRTPFLVLGAVALVIAVAVGTVLFFKAQNDTKKEDLGITSLDQLAEGAKAAFKDPSKISPMLFATETPLSVMKNVGGVVWVHPDAGSKVMSLYARYEVATESQTDLNAQIAFLKENKFNEVVSVKQLTKLNAPDPTLKHFSNGTIVCTLKNGQEVSPEVSYFTLSLDCALSSDFAKNEETVKPFLASYASGPFDDGADVAFRRVDIQKSATEGYQNAQVTIAKLSSPGAAVFGQFYQTPDSSWHYFTAASDRDKIACDAFNSTELKSAFLGFTCWDTATSKSSYVLMSTPVTPDPTAIPDPTAFGG